MTQDGCVTSRLSLQHAYKLGMPVFRLGSNVHENVRALRVALGSIARELSLAELGRVITERHPAGRQVSATLVQRWEQGVEPDLASLRIMAELAGVPVAAFAYGPESGGEVPRDTPEPRMPPMSPAPTIPLTGQPAEKKRAGNGGGGAGSVA